MPYPVAETEVPFNELDNDLFSVSRDRPTLMMRQK